MLAGWLTNVGGCIPQRYVIAVMGFLGVVNAYTMRICLSIAITEMVAPRVVSYNLTQLDPDSCPSDDVQLGVRTVVGTFLWDERTQGLILSSFFWGYVITHLPGGLLAEKIGGKYCLGLGILSTAVFTLLTPVAAIHGGAAWVIALRFFQGLGEGPTYPALNALLAQWAPPQERSQLGSLVFAGALIGTVLGSAVSGQLLQSSTMGWPCVFYFFGGLGIAWFIFWQLLCYNDPSSHPFISNAEKQLLQEALGATKRNKDTPPVPWRAIGSSVPLWGLICAQIGHDWGFFTMVTDLPKYMKDVMKFKISQNGYLSSIPYLVMWFVSLGSGWLADWVIVRKFLSATNTRKLFTTIASVGPAVGILAASYAGCDRTAVVVLFTIAMGFMGTFYPGMKVNALDLSPNYAGTLMAIVNGIGAITGIITPYLIGVLTPDSTMTQWRMVFWIAGGVLVITNIIFLLTASGEVQPWNSPQKYETDEEETKREQYKSVKDILVN